MCNETYTLSNKCKHIAPIDYRFNGSRGAVLCRKCRVIIDERISYEDAVVKWEGRDLCEDCKDKEVRSE